MLKKWAFFVCLCVNVRVVFAGEVEYIRAFDLGGQGLKTALLRYDRNAEGMEWMESKTQLGKCPDDREVDEWIRIRMQEVLGKNIDAEIDAGYLFGFSLAGLNKLRSQALESSDMSILCKLPADRTRCIDDGGAHLVASLNTLDLAAFQGPIWNFCIGTGVGWGFTNGEHRVRNLSDFWAFFEGAPWFVKEPRTGLDVWMPCSSHYGFDQIVADNEERVDEGVFTEFALRWKAYVEECILEYGHKRAPNKDWGMPAALVFTGGHIDVYGDRLVNLLHLLDLSVPLFTGPRNAGLLGAAWNSAINEFDQTPLMKMITSLSIDNVKSLISQGVDVNERDLLGKSPLSVAIEGGSLELVKLLVQSGAGINIADFSGKTPLSLAVRSNQLDIVAFLLNEGADPHLADYWEQTPLFLAREHKNIESLLLEHEAILATDKTKQ